MQITWTINTDSAIRLSDYLKAQGLSRKLLTKLKQYPNSILVNNQASRLSHWLEAGDQVRVNLPKEPANPNLVANPGLIDIIYEDTYFIIINKKAHQPTLPSHSNREHSLANELLQYYIDKDADNLRIHPVTRLDKNTSGLTLFAKHQYIHHLLTDQSSIKKQYLAFISGKIQPTSGQIDYPIQRASHSIIERQVGSAGKPAQTAYQVVWEKEAGSLVEVDLITGRTHQIRVHFAHLGHPLLGDDLYGGTTDYIDRQALHCHQLALTHPITGKIMQFQAPLPDDLRQLKTVL